MKIKSFSSFLALGAGKTLSLDKIKFKQKTVILLDEAHLSFPKSPKRNLFDTPQKVTYLTQKLTEEGKIIVEEYKKFLDKHDGVAFECPNCGNLHDSNNDEDWCDTCLNKY